MRKGIDFSWLTFRDHHLAESREKYAENSKGDIYVAAIAPWKGLSEGNVFLLEGIQFAVDEFNQSGGLQGRDLKLLEIDDSGTLVGAENAAVRVCRDPKISAVIGHYSSGCTSEVLPFYAAEGMPLLVPVANDGAITQKGYENVFRFAPTTADYAAALAEKMGVDGIKNVMVIQYYNLFAEGWSNHLQVELFQKNIRVVERYRYDEGSDQFFFKKMVEQMLEEHAGDFDAIFIVNSMPHWETVLELIRESGIEVPIYSSNSDHSDEYLQSRPVLDGMIYCNSADWSKEPLQEFTKRFRDKYGFNPGNNSYCGYAAARVYCEALKTAGSAMPSKIYQAVHQLDMNILGEPFAFESNGDLKQPAIVIKTVEVAK